ncbi:IS3 family transposase [Peribacillus sp. NPDC060253]|uniref:IS3 family transposase n=1 Tax=Peribacillus sp. NPDC060253 TaxID=3347084 RepID=UPI0025B673BA|nr:IS3 family transposase [Peribacillus sp. Bi96]
MPRITYYYEEKIPSQTDEVTPKVIEIFHTSCQNYGTRKIKVELQKCGYQISRRRIGRVMKEEGLVSTYTIAQFKPHGSTCNESKKKNELNREFRQEEAYSVVVSDLTYVRGENKWHDICVLVDLYNLEIIGYGTGARKDAQLVYQGISSIKVELNKIMLFHTDRGSEFKNKWIDEALETFEIKRSLSMKGCPYDNACIESFNALLKKEEVNHVQYLDYQTAKLAMFQFIEGWYNRKRIHSSLGYQIPQAIEDLIRNTA